MIYVIDWGTKVKGARYALVNSKEEELFWDLDEIGEITEHVKYAKFRLGWTNKMAEKFMEPYYMELADKKTAYTNSYEEMLPLLKWKYLLEEATKNITNA